MGSDLGSFLSISSFTLPNTSGFHSQMKFSRKKKINVALIQTEQKFSGGHESQPRRNESSELKFSATSHPMSFSASCRSETPRPAAALWNRGFMLMCSSCQVETIRVCFRKFIEYIQDHFLASANRVWDDPEKGLIYKTRNVFMLLWTFFNCSCIHQSWWFHCVEKNPMMDKRNELWQLRDLSACTVRSSGTYDVLMIKAMFLWTNLAKQRN